MDSLTELRRDINRIACPKCQKFKFDLCLRDEMSYNEYSYYAAKCLFCGYTFALSTETRELQKIEPDIEKRLSELHCRSCGQNGARLKFWCNFDQKIYLYLAACNHCGYISHHYR